ncbi:RING finger protein nenya [Drosophila simulans]|uniref:GD18048 n=1 Tax=Drosophila simulans TaxID=7240 RepID=B4QY56_DROSI|nr:RING finger protein nenya [Drosophila simulans]EDX14704.1 GD18048 [Drosophila simulans]KMZ06386.1 uncharacterized protein Dsimw501_GD18048 [Drosophila simulans]
MFRIHCNKCYRRRNVEPSMVFHMTQCQHVLCASCLSESSTEKKCPLCKRDLRAIPIDRNLPANVAHYFEDPLRFQQLYRKISKFQADQRASDNLGFYRQMQEHEKNESRLKGFCKMEAQFNQQIQKEKERIAELRAYIKYHEEEGLKKWPHATGDEKPWSNQARRLRPRTPSVTTSDNTQSDEHMTTFCLDSDMDCLEEDETHRSDKKTFNGNIKDFQI